MDFKEHEVHQQLSGKNIRELVLGFNDGIVTTFAVVAGVSGASVGSSIIILAGLANAIAGAISMALNLYLSIKSQIEYYRQEIEREKKEIEEIPAMERQEIRDIYKAKGFHGKELDMIVKRITSNKKRWLDVMMREELGLAPEQFENPIKASVNVFIAFVVASMIPLLPYVFFPAKQALAIASVAFVITLFIAGAAKSYITHIGWLKSGLEMLFIGVVASVLTYYVGTMFAV